MSARLDLVLQKFPEHEAGVRALAARDPSGNLKYLDWGARALAAGQALAPEIADVLDLFHQFAGQRIDVDRAIARLRGADRAIARLRRGHRHAPVGIKRIHPDLYTYRPQDLATLRDNLLKAKRARDKRRKQRERLYRIEGSIEAEVVHDSPDLVVRHIQNKQASAHHGLGTKWCIAMLREGYFDDYEANNATFFFFERKHPVGDEFDKVALMVPRAADAVTQAFTALDRLVDMMSLAKVYGPHVFDIFRAVHECSERYPGSAVFCVYAGTATSEQIESVFANLKSSKRSPRTSPFYFGMREILEAICCNDAAPLPVLDEILRSAATLFTGGAWRRSRRRGMRRGAVQDLERTIESALVIHPNVPVDVRETIAKRLRRRHVKLDMIHRVTNHGHVGVSYQKVEVFGRYHRRRYRRRRLTVKALRARAGVFDQAAARLRRSAKRLQRKLAEKKLKAKKAAKRG